jgi:hypothetical protein
MAEAVEPERFFSRGKDGRVQRRRVRKDGWSARRRAIFLDHYAATGNASEACRAAGMSEGAAARLRRRDPEFAAQYDEAHATALVRLEGLLAQYAETKGRIVAVEPGEVPPVDMANFDPELALRILSRRRPTTGGFAGRCGAKPHRASKAELVAAIQRLVAVVRKRRAKQAGA